MIEFRGVAKRFGAQQVLGGVDLFVAPGQIMGLVGPNGAGKTTLIKLLLGLAHPTSGTMRVRGAAIAADDAYRAHIGYMPQIARFPENLSAAELFGMVRSLRATAPADQDRLVARFGLAGQIDRPLRVLSGGTRQKVNAVLALMFRPPVLVLDEPTAGLDPASSVTLKDDIRERGAEGAAVLVTSHIMSELEEMCDQVAFLLDGAIRYVGPIAALRAHTRQANLERAIAELMIREVA
ncbi:MAG: ABC transporter ATP-binding protein [Gemmatimonadales bacterium]